MRVKASFIRVLQGWERWLKRAESDPWVLQPHREIFHVHETVTWAERHRSPETCTDLLLTQRWAAGWGFAVCAQVDTLIAYLQPLSFFSIFPQMCFSLMEIWAILCSGNTEPMTAHSNWSERKDSIAHTKVSLFYIFLDVAILKGTVYNSKQRCHLRRWAGFCVRKIKNRNTGEGRCQRERERARERTQAKKQEQRQKKGWERRTTSLHMLRNNHSWICRSSRQQILDATFSCYQAGSVHLNLFASLLLCLS